MTERLIQLKLPHTTFTLPPSETLVQFLYGMEDDYRMAAHKKMEEAKTAYDERNDVQGAATLTNDAARLMKLAAEITEVAEEIEAQESS